VHTVIPANRPAKTSRAALCVSGLLLVLIEPTASMASIYRCNSDGNVIYSDRPCAAGAVVHESDSSRVTVYEAPPISEHASVPRPAARNKSADKRAQKNNQQSAIAAAKRQQNCAKLEQALRDTRTKLRTGYGVKEGERLKARQRQLAERRRQQKCR
jgi:hypothetical protein